MKMNAASTEEFEQDLHEYSQSGTDALYQYSMVYFKQNLPWRNVVIIM